MLRSMTGYGRGKYENDSREYIVEIKSVNNRYSDINIKMPKTISFLEDKVKKEIGKYITRGKVEVFISLINNSDTGKNISINKDLAKKYIEELKTLVSETNIIDNISIMEVSKLPDVLIIQPGDQSEETIWKELQMCLQEAGNNFLDMRQKEGEIIKLDLENRMKYIISQIDKINNISTGLVEQYIVKLEKRINELLKSDVIDQSRLAQEVVIYSDKCSVQEEITRLKSHFTQFSQLILEDKPIGKKIDFLIQEMNRETNTIGSKANNLDITQLVVEIKTELENIREQIQNIE